MKKILNNIFVFSKDKYLHKDHDTIVVDQKTEDGEERVLQMPAHAVAGIYIYNTALVSSYLVQFCAENNINLAYFSESGRFLGRFENGATGNVVLRKKQFLLSEQNKIDLATTQIIAKLRSSSNLLQRHLRNNTDIDTEIFDTSLNIIRIELRKLRDGDYNTLDEIRGAEGIGASAYFSCFSSMIKNKSFVFSGRSKRPPRDAVNAMLSYLYTIMASDITGAIDSVGLDSQEGFLHSDKSGRCSLALDLMEEFRAFIVDRLVLAMINRQEISSDEFENDVCNGTNMSLDVRKYITKSYQQKKKEIITHELLGEKMPIGLLFNTQALLYARYLRGDLDTYPPFYFR